MAEFKPTTKSQLVTAVSDWFNGAVNNTNPANSFLGQNIRDWNVILVTDMSELFSGKDMSGLDLSRWNVINVTNFSGMFRGASNCSNLNLSRWDTSSATNMNAMFISSDFNGDIPYQSTLSSVLPISNAANTEPILAGSGITINQNQWTGGDIVAGGITYTQDALNNTIAPEILTKTETVINSVITGHRFSQKVNITFEWIYVPPDSNGSAPLGRLYPSSDLYSTQNPLMIRSVVWQINLYFLGTSTGILNNGLGDNALGGSSYVAEINTGIHEVIHAMMYNIDHFLDKGLAKSLPATIYTSGQSQSNEAGGGNAQNKSMYVYTGENGVREYNGIVDQITVRPSVNVALNDGAFVSLKDAKRKPFFPLEDDFAPGSRDSHPNEGWEYFTFNSLKVIQYETHLFEGVWYPSITRDILSPIGGEKRNVITRMTVGVLNDVGYQVNYSSPYVDQLDNLHNVDAMPTAGGVTDHEKYMDYHTNDVARYLGVAPDVEYYLIQAGANWQPGDGYSYGPMINDSYWPRRLGYQQQPPKAWDVSSVTDMTSMFEQNTAFNGNVSNWVTSSVTATEKMFKGASAFNVAINNWNMTNVTNADSMFYGSSDFNQDLSSWRFNSIDIAGLVNMFYQATSFNQDISAWTFRADANIGGMFTGTTALSDANKCAISQGSAWQSNSLTDNDGFMTAFSAACNTGGEGGGGQGATGGDPYVRVLDGSIYKLDNISGTCRLMQGQLNGKVFLINAEMKMDSVNKEKEMNEWSKSASDGVDVEELNKQSFYSSVFIQYGNSICLINLETGEVKAGGSDLLKISPLSKNTSSLPMYSEERSFNGCTVKAGSVSISAIVFANKQLRNEIVLEGVKAIKNADGFIVRPMSTSDCLLESITDSSILSIKASKYRGSVKERFYSNKNKQGKIMNISAM